MNIHMLRAAPAPPLAAALGAFERQFRYPLGPGRTFRIEHGDDYPRFFRAMGDGACFVAERDGRVLGVIGTAVRRLVFPDGTERAVLYIGDLKVDPAVRGGRTFLELATAVHRWVDGRVEAAYGVVMQSTPAIPTAYSGRLGIPRFDELATVTILRIPTAAAQASAETDGRNDWAVAAEVGAACARRLSAGCHVGLDGDPAERSEIEPTWLVSPDGRACGRLEDTHPAKRLIADDGSEMRSAHLSCFAHADAEAGAAMLDAACRLAAGHGLPALFVAVAPNDAGRISQHLTVPGIVVAPAVVYGTGFGPGATWNISTAEI